MTTSTSASRPTTLSRRRCAWLPCCCWKSFIRRSKELETAFRKKGREFDKIIKSGRTHLQDAVPVRLGQEFAAYAVALEQLRKHIRQNAEPLADLGIGGSAVGTGLNAHPKYPRLVVKRLSALTGLRLHPAADLRAAMQSQFPLASVSGGVAQPGA